MCAKYGSVHETRARRTCERALWEVEAASLGALYKSILFPRVVPDKGPRTDPGVADEHYP
jgi:hypothetical protein